MVAGSTGETETIESHRFSFLVDGAMACPRFDSPVPVSDMRILGSPLTPAPNGRFWQIVLKKSFSGEERKYEERKL
jgi:hypothetical protein